MVSDGIRYHSSESEMKIIRSSKTSLKFATAKKQEIINEILDEYARVANFFIGWFWEHPEIRTKNALTKEIYNLADDTWLSARMRQCAAREALGMVLGALSGAKEKGIDPVRPRHTGKKMILSSQIVRIEKGRNSFDIWLVIRSVGNKIKIRIPLKSHRHMNLFSDWKRADSVVIHRNYVMFSFEKETGAKKETGKCIGIDVGISHLLATSEGYLYGSETKNLINKIKRKKQGSKAYKRAKKTLSYYLHRITKECLEWDHLRLVVVERLKNLKQNGRKKKNRTKEFRKTLSNWNYRELLRIIEMRSEENRVSFRSVNPYKTSQTCPACSHAERGNRINENFKCLKCGYSGQADIVGSLNILTRFTTGRYGAGFKTF